MLELKQSVDSLERLNRHTAEQAAPFRASWPLPETAEEGTVIVAQADGKGLVIRRSADQPKIHGLRTKGQKANRKRIVVVGAVYSMDPYGRLKW